MINKNSPCEPVDHTATAIASVVDRIASNHNLMTLSLSGGVDSTALALILRGVAGEKMPITGSIFIARVLQTRMNGNSHTLQQTQQKYHY